MVRPWRVRPTSPGTWFPPVGRLLKAAALWLAWFGGSLPAHPPDTASGLRRVQLDGRAVRVQVVGLDRREAGRPMVVFEGGLTNTLEVWGQVLPRVTNSAPVVAYDRAGLGRSVGPGVITGTFVLSNHTTHAVPREDPALVVWAIQRVLSETINRR